MQNSLEKHASDAYALLIKRANEDAETYAGEGFKRGILGGAAAGAGLPLYNWAAKGMKPAIKATAGRSIATAGLWGIVGGLGGGAIKRKAQPDYSYQGYYQ